MGCVRPGLGIVDRCECSRWLGWRIEGTSWEMLVRAAWDRKLAQTSEELVKL